MIYFASDHAGYGLKQELIAFFSLLGKACSDIGTHSGTESCNYAEYGRRAAAAVAENPGAFGVLVCGTGAGISMAANKLKGIRCACASEPSTARLTREHNDANMIALGARIVGIELAKDIITAFLETPFSGDERHLGRISTIEGRET
ncbi:MAG: ribose 5-phosphate isomerase B [Oscillospiraceae bacterium]|nr:ribose 5-phosphate isomerase B [Oscillospiraceae bacterium]